jgi:hypothetical protein
MEEKEKKKKRRKRRKRRRKREKRSKEERNEEGRKENFKIKGKKNSTKTRKNMRKYTLMNNR